jgi:thiamine-monophosphate kinase
VTSEAAFIESLRQLASHPAARGLLDDVAVMEVGGTKLVLTSDMIAEGVHFMSGDPPGDVAWKLVAVNLSDLAGKGARPLGALLGYSLGDDDWDKAFVTGLASALEAFGLPLLGGDTVRISASTPRTLALTAIGEASGQIPSRAGGKAGDLLWVSGSIGDAGAGLRALADGIEGAETLIERYRLPRPRLEAGLALAPLVHAMMDVSDGLLIDVDRLARASGLAATVELDAIPLSAPYIAALGEDREARLEAASAGDDYELLFSAPQSRAAQFLALADELGLPLSRIGRLRTGDGLALCDRDGAVPLPDRLGYEH